MPNEDVSLSPAQFVKSAGVRIYAPSAKSFSISFHVSTNVGLSSGRSVLPDTSW